jgi:hypothetical protein
MASRKEQKEQLRAERERKAQEAASAERRKRMVGFGAAGLLVAVAVIAIAVVVLAGGGDDKSSNSSNGGEDRAAEPTNDFPKGSIPKAKATTLEDAAKAAKCTVKQFPSEGRSHVSGKVEYKTNPPTSGNHFEIPASDGAYNTPPDVEPLVHSLEHGRVIFWFRPGAPAQLQGQMKALYDEDNFHVILAPYARKLSGEVAASAWTRSIVCPTVNENTWDALRLFRDRYRDQGPEQVA